MTIYDLIQELVQYDANSEVRIKAKIGKFEYECDNCETTLDIPSDVYDMSIDELERNGRTIEICCED